MLRDLSDYKIQFISIFLMAFLGVFIFAGVGGEAISLEDNANNYYHDTNLADGWIYASNIDEDFVNKVNDLSPTTQSERQMVVTSQADFSNNPDVELHFIDDNKISKFYAAEGDDFNSNDEDGVWLDKNFAHAKGLKVGDKITFEFNGMEIEKEIRGLGYSPEYVYSVPYYGIKPDHDELGFAYMSYKAFPNENVPYNVLNVKFDGNAKDYNNLLSEVLGDDYSSFLQRHDHSSVAAYQNMIYQFKMIGDLLPIIFILISMLMLLTSMKRIITHQRTQIGVLKANGFKNRPIIMHYLSYALIVFLGALLGLIIGPIFIHQVAYPPLGEMFVLPYFNHVGVMSFAYIIVIIVILALIVTYYSIRDIINEHPSTIIKPKPPKATTSAFIEKFSFWNHLSFNFRWNYRDVKRHNFRAIVTVLGVLGCVVILIYAFGLYDGMTGAEQWEFDKINQFESKLMVDNDATLSQIDDVAKQVDGDKIMESAIEIESNSDTNSASLLVLDGTDLIVPTNVDQNEIEINDNEVAISQKMVDLLGVGVGDTVRFHIMGSDKWVKVKIDKIYGHPSKQGLIMSSEKLDELGLNYTTTSIVTSKHVEGDYDGIKSIFYHDDMIDSTRDINRSLWIMIYDLIAFAVILALIVLYNLGTLSFLEMERDIGTLKVLGFNSTALTKLLLTQCFVFLIIGGLLGIPLGLRVLQLVWESSSEQFFMVPHLSLINLVCTFLIIFAVSIAVNLYFYFKIRKLDMVDTLKIFE